jgi:putative transposase
VQINRRSQQGRVVVHSDQGSQYGSDAWLRFCDAHRLDPSMSRRGNLGSVSPEAFEAA